MKTIDTIDVVDVIMVKIYITESSKLLKPTLEYLKHEANIRGVSVFRAIRGFGESGNHASSLIDLSLDLPLAIEFFDEENKVNIALEHLAKTIKPEHMVFWSAKANV